LKNEQGMDINGFENNEPLENIPKEKNNKTKCIGIILIIISFVALILIGFPILCVQQHV